MQFTDIKCGLADAGWLNNIETKFNVAAETAADDGSMKREWRWLTGAAGLERDEFDATKLRGMIGVTMNAEDVAAHYGVTAQQVWDALDAYIAAKGLPNLG